MTKVDPAKPIKKRMAIRLSALLTTPVSAVGIAAKVSIIVKRTRDPNLSHNGPRAKRKRIVPATLAILEDQTSTLLKLRDFLTSGRRGATANQIKNAMKKFHQEQWKARMWGLAKEHNLISVALSSCSGSTLREYVWYFFISGAYNI